jgi:hypothetical protein
MAIGRVRIGHRANDYHSNKPGRVEFGSTGYHAGVKVQRTVPSRLHLKMSFWQTFLSSLAERSETEDPSCGRKATTKVVNTRGAAGATRTMLRAAAPPVVYGCEVTLSRDSLDSRPRYARPRMTILLRARMTKEDCAAFMSRLCRRRARHGLENGCYCITRTASPRLAAIPALRNSSADKPSQ